MTTGNQICIFRPGRKHNYSGSSIAQPSVSRHVVRTLITFRVACKDRPRHEKAACTGNAGHTSARLKSASTIPPTPMTRTKHNKNEFRSSRVLSGAPFQSKRRLRTTPLSIQILRRCTDAEAPSTTDVEVRPLVRTLPTGPPDFLARNRSLHGPPPETELTKMMMRVFGLCTTRRRRQTLQTL